MPSIIPDGAITSAPARAWLTPARPGAAGSRRCPRRAGRRVSRQRAAMAVVGVLAEADVGDDQQPGRLPLGRAGSPPGRSPRRRERGRAARVLVRGDAEEEDRRDAQLGDLGDRLAEAVERELVLAGHRGDLAPQVRAVVDEQRVDQVVDRQPMLADQVAEPGMAAEPAGAMERVAGGGLVGHRGNLDGVEADGTGDWGLPTGSNPSLTQSVPSRRASSPRRFALTDRPISAITRHALPRPARATGRGSTGSVRAREGPSLSAIGPTRRVLLLGLAGPARSPCRPAGRGRGDRRRARRLRRARRRLDRVRAAPAGRPGHRPRRRAPGLARRSTRRRARSAGSSSRRSAPPTRRARARVIAARAVVRSGHPEARMPGLPRVDAGAGDDRPAPRSPPPDPRPGARPADLARHRAAAGRRPPHPGRRGSAWRSAAGPRRATGPRRADRRGPGRLRAAASRPSTRRPSRGRRRDRPDRVDPPRDPPRTRSSSGGSRGSASATRRCCESVTDSASGNAIRARLDVVARHEAMAKDARQIETLLERSRRRDGTAGPLSAPAGRRRRSPRPGPTTSRG